ncbi:MAG TPA: glycosyltransferase [Chthoniobacterales bacterium]|nr:glycosyltransferase [Chthoniobacterales bacterium]
MASPDKPLRILMIVNLPWDPRLGASRVWMELAEQWRAAGHTVEKFSLSDAFPGVRAARVTFALRQLIFIRKAAAFVKQNAQRFDVIDALIGTLPYSKAELGFSGIIVARSVGLYLLYDRFERSVQHRWPRPRQGKLLGRLLYGFTRRRLLQASDAAVRHADVINVPNEEEAACLRKEFGSSTRIVVIPYGLTNSSALHSAQRPAEIRLPEKRICFIGMWGARKGAYDWRRIIERVRAEVPDARFRFLGTMVASEAVRADLGPAAEDVELISDYQPDELPRLLADCTAGAFPSYAEGFGLAVIEQLAAGIPVVAYDTAGPRDILKEQFSGLLVPPGDTDSFAAALCRLLRSTPAAYAELSRASTAAVARYAWSAIADTTLQYYRRVLDQSSRPVVFVQPFSVGSAGGGARILRALLEEAPVAAQSVCCSPEKPKRWRNELHLRTRPSWGRIEHSRFASLPKSSTRLFAPSFRRRLRRLCRQVGARAIHAVPHAGLDFADAQAVARELSLPYFISLHDDLAYTALDVVDAAKREAAMRSAWQEASGRFVISDLLGREYCERYGGREFQVVTDGLKTLSPPRVESDGNALRIYFMGLFHMAYERNLRALLDAVELVERERPGMSISVTMRCEHVRPQVIAGARHVAVLPFADEAQVQCDMEQADLLYMPIPFGEEHENFARYSLSTKMVTYVGSGIPLVYHGPTTSAAYRLLSANHAAITLATLDPAAIAAELSQQDGARREQIAANALALAQREFMLADQTRKFWGTLGQRLTKV